MYLDCLQSHLSVCAQPDLPVRAKQDPDFWNVVSIREPERPDIDRRGYQKVCPVFFHDVVGLEGLGKNHGFILPRPEHLQQIFRFADSVAGEPLLVHCWAGVSRSTAVALALIVRALHWEGCEADEITSHAPDLLIGIRPKAVPNPLVLGIALELFLEASVAQKLTADLLNHPTFFSNRYPGATPAP